MNQELLATATKNVTDVLTLAIEHRAPDRALVVYDTRHGLTDIMTAAYRNALPDARFIDFDKTSKEEILAAFDEMSPKDLVVLIQSSNFLLDAFRIRLHLFNKGLKVIEHLHLHRNSEKVWDVYINSIAYDINWYRNIGPWIKSKLDPAKELRIEGEDAVLTVSGPLLPSLLNIGNYVGMKNVGGTLPIGEVITECVNFADVNGTCKLFAYADDDFETMIVEPFRVDIKESLVVGWADNAPESFGRMVEHVKQYERPIIREFGFGLNRAVTKERYLEDITAFERLVGLHLSLGEKHSIYKKEGIVAHKSKFHIDIFLVTDRMLVDGVPFFENGKFLMPEDYKSNLFK